MKCYAIENHPNDSRVNIDPAGIVQCLSSRMGTGGNNTPFVLIDSSDTTTATSFVCNSSGNGIAAPLDASYYKGQGLRQGIEREYVMMKAYATGNGQLANSVISENTVGTLDCMHDQKMVIIDNDKPHYYTKQRHDEFIDGDVASSLKSRDYKEFTDLIQGETMEKKYVLRRLTPTECLRLQGLPDWWCDGANGSDSAIYRMCGNGLAIPCACDVLGRIAEELRKDE